MSTSDVLGIIGIVVAVAAVPIGYLLGRRAMQQSDLRYIIQTTVIIAEKQANIAPGLKLSIDGDPLKSVVRTRVAVYNARGASIRGTSILPKDPLRIEFPKESKLISARPTHASRPISVVMPRRSDKYPSTVFLTFDLLAARDGTIIEVTHEEARTIEVLGSLDQAQPRRSRIQLRESVFEEVGRLKKLRRRLGSAFRLLVLAALSIGLFASTVFLFYSWFTYSPPKPTAPIDLRYFDLTTFQGRKYFAGYMNEIYRPPGRVLIFVSSMLVLLIFGVFAWSLVHYWRLRVPRRLLRPYDPTLPDELFDPANLSPETRGSPVLESETPVGSPELKQGE